VEWRVAGITLPSGVVMRSHHHPLLE